MNARAAVLIERRFSVMSGELVAVFWRRGGRLARFLEQAERISRSMVEVRVVDGALLLDADPT